MPSSTLRVGRSRDGRGAWGRVPTVATSWVAPKTRWRSPRSLGSPGSSALVQGQFHDLAGAGRLVDRADDLDRLAALAAVHQGRGASVDGVEEVGELVAVAGVVDAARVAGARLEAAGRG